MPGKAVEYVEERDFIILDASSTAWYMASELPDIPLTVLTNSIKAALELSGKNHIEVISTGGTLTSRSLSFVGPLAEQSLERYHVNKAFISCKGLHLDRGLSESNEMQARLKQKMMQISDRIFVLADSSKFGVQSFTYVSPLTAMDVLVTDSKADPALLGSLREKQIRVVGA